MEDNKPRYTTARLREEVRKAKEAATRDERERCAKVSLDWPLARLIDTSAGGSDHKYTFETGARAQARTIYAAIMGGATNATHDQKDEKLGQAYQVIAALLLPSAEPEAQRALDYFAGDEFDPDFLPWPRNDGDANVHGV